MNHFDFKLDQFNCEQFFFLWNTETNPKTHRPTDIYTETTNDESERSKQRLVILELGDWSIDCRQSYRLYYGICGEAIYSDGRDGKWHILFEDITSRF